jgi:hypothetical protein
MIGPFASISAAFLFAQIQASAPAPALTPEQWREDLAYLASEWPKRHKNLFHYVSETDWRAAVKRLDEKIPQLQRHEIIVEIGRLGAMIKDSHTGIGTFRQEAIAFHRLPIEMSYFADGVFIVRAAPQYRALLGARVLKVGSAEVKTALDSVANFISSDPGNPMRALDIGPIMLGMPEVMQSLHFIPALSEIQLTVEKDGKPFTSSLAPVTLREYGATSWVSWQPVKPLALSRLDRKFWFTYLPADRMMYVQINEMENDSAEYLAETFQKAVSQADSVPVDRFVIDLRYNGGGSSNAVRPIILSLVRSPKIDQHGRLFVLIGRVTASAAQNLANDLERFTNSVFIGEPTAQNPNFYSDGYAITLPNSKIVAYNAVIWSQFAARETRTYSAPNVVAEWSSSDYRDGRDPGLAAVRSYAASKPLPARITEIASRLGTKAAGDSLAAVAASGVQRYRNLSRDMIRYSFDELWTNGRSGEAVLLLESNAVAFADDWNSHDALAGAYENKGKLDEALREYQRALELNPTHEGVKDGINRVKERLRTR